MAVTTTGRPACPFTTTPSGSRPLTNAVGGTLAPGDFAVGCCPARRRNEKQAPQRRPLRSAATSPPTGS